ncbi:hypothetical protein [Candidatus Poriferisodalis sp.]|uniref:hypothetical protein n=1 Tax=Candidatus Poriferisodalis sp. TaxID=3101277 RepID=UPI003B021384
MVAAWGLVRSESLRRSSCFEAWRTRLWVIALAWGAGWFVFAETSAVWLRLGLLVAVGLWAVQGAALVWVASMRRLMHVD